MQQSSSRRHSIFRVVKAHPLSSLSPWGVGANTFTGTLPVSLGTTDLDAFRVSNPSLLGITSISISITNYVGTTDPTRDVGNFQILSPNFGRENIIGDGFYTLATTLNDSSQLTIGIAAPYDPQNLENGSMNYQVTINAVPEPSSSVLMATLALVGALRRKRNA